MGAEAFPGVHGRQGRARVPEDGDGQGTVAGAGGRVAFRCRLVVLQAHQRLARVGHGDVLVDSAFSVAHAGRIEFPEVWPLRDELEGVSTSGERQVHGGKGLRRATVGLAHQAPQFVPDGWDGFSLVSECVPDAAGVAVVASGLGTSHCHRQVRMLRYPGLGGGRHRQVDGSGAGAMVPRADHEAGRATPARGPRRLDAAGGRIL